MLWSVIDPDAVERSTTAPMTNIYPQLGINEVELGGINEARRSYFACSHPTIFKKFPLFSKLESDSTAPGNRGANFLSIFRFFNIIFSPFSILHKRNRTTPYLHNPLAPCLYRTRLHVMPSTNHVSRTDTRDLAESRTFF